jgi:hypothetical protein
MSVLLTFVRASFHGRLARSITCEVITRPRRPLDRRGRIVESWIAVPMLANALVTSRVADHPADRLARSAVDEELPAGPPVLFARLAVAELASADYQLIYRARP